MRCLDQVIPGNEKQRLAVGGAQRCKHFGNNRVDVIGDPEFMAKPGDFVQA